MATAAEARAARFEATSRRRLDEARDAWDFLYHGEKHECIRPSGNLTRAPLEPGHHTAVDRSACSRDYNPGPPPEDEKMYEGTGIGALYGGAHEITYVNHLEDGTHLAVTRSHVAQLAGWNVLRGARAR